MDSRRAVLGGPRAAGRQSLKQACRGTLKEKGEVLVISSARSPGGSQAAYPPSTRQSDARPRPYPPVRQVSRSPSPQVPPRSPVSSLLSHCPNARHLPRETQPTNHPNPVPPSSPDSYLALALVVFVFAPRTRCGTTRTTSTTTTTSANLRYTTATPPCLPRSAFSPCNRPYLHPPTRRFTAVNCLQQLRLRCCRQLNF